jgi:hypothetical protein
MANSIATGVAYQDPQLNLVAFTAYTVATAPSASPAGQVAYFSNGKAGDPILAFSNGTNWLRCDTALAISAS